MKMRLRILVLTVMALGLAGIAQATSLDFDFHGNFIKDNDVVLIAFSVSNLSTVTVFSSSWIQGNSSGVPQYGFDPMLGIWTSSGSLISFQDDGGNTGTTSSNGVPYYHGDWDSFYIVTLSPGNYLASVSQYDNFPNQNSAGGALSAGFVHDGQPNFTAVFGAQPLFNGVSSGADARTSYWEFHLLNVDQAVVVGGAIPEPTSLLLLGTGLGMLGLTAWRRKK